MQNWVKRGHLGVTWLLTKEMQNCVKRGNLWVTWPTFGILGPPNISRMVKAKNFKFGTETDGSEFKQKKCKIGQKGSCGGHVTHFWNFGTPLISREWLKLDTLNLARRRMAVSSNERNAKLRQKGSSQGHVTNFWNFGTP